MRALFLLVALTLSPALAADAAATRPVPGHPSLVRVVESGGRYQLLVNGQPFYVKGGGLESGNQEALAAAGGRLRDTGKGRLGFHAPVTPGAYRRGGEGVHIRYTTAATAVGRLLVAATDRGVCAVTLGDDDVTLENALNSEYPRAARTRVRGGKGNDDLRGWVAAVTAHLEGSDIELAIPLDVAGTPFQQRVWGALQRIPYGETRSYTQVAASIKAPAAVRAVAGACATNRVSIVIPCHRVVRQGGALGGYRWGLARKKRLLTREHAFAAKRVR